MSPLALAFSLAVATAAPGDPSGSAWVESTLERLTLREKVAQMVMPWIPGGQPRRRSADWRRARELVEKEKVGGVIVGKGAAQGTAAWLNDLQKRSGVPLLVAADLEWGAGMRLEGATVLPVNMAIGAAGDASFAYEAGRITAREARAAGVHMAFAPVADVNVNAANPVINTRSYGADPEAVAQRVVAFIRGAQSSGLLTAAKHFPGHGDTEKDSHLTLPVLNARAERLEAVELVPFRAAMAAGVAGVMTAHVAYPALDPSGAPATLSPAIVSDLLRRELGFEGLIVTDGLMMDGVRKGRTVGEVALEAVRAGADILLMPPSASEAIDAVVGAVEAGEIDAARIDASVRRILEAKVAVGLHRKRLVDPSELRRTLGSRAHRRWAQMVADRSLTLVRQAEDRLPIALAGRKVLSIVYDDVRGSRDGREFHEELERQGADVTVLRVWRRSTATDLLRMELSAHESDVVLFSSYARAVPWKGHLGLPAEAARVLDRLAATGTLVVSFGDPYLLRQLPRARTYLLAWSETETAQRAAARALAGEVEIAGRLPIPLPPFHGIGGGLTAPGLAGKAAADRLGEPQAPPRPRDR